MACWFCFAYVGEVAALHLGRQGETSLARASPLPETVLGGWCEFCLEERRKKRRMAPVHAQHHKPNPLLPAVDLQLEADSWCLVGVVCSICDHAFFYFLLTHFLSSFFPYLDLGPFLLAILARKVEKSDKRSIYLFGKHFEVWQCCVLFESLQMAEFFGITPCTFNGVPLRFFESTFELSLERVWLWKENLSLAS